MKNRICRWLLALVFPLLGLLFSAKAEAKVLRDQNEFPVFSQNLKTLKKEMGEGAVRWWRAKYQGRTFHVCREDHPFFSVSRYDVHAWYEASDGRLFHVWSTRTHGIGEIRVDINEVAGTVSVFGVERKVKGKRLAFFSLGAAAP